MKAALGIDVNKKIQLKLSDDAGSEAYTCLVKKVKENLVALVISNKDKNNVNPSLGEKLFLLNEWEDDYWITPVSLIQNQSFPLIILKVVEEPYLAAVGKPTPPAPIEGIDSIVEDHSASDEDVALPSEVSEEPIIIPKGFEKHVDIMADEKHQKPVDTDEGGSQIVEEEVLDENAELPPKRLPDIGEDIFDDLADTKVVAEHSIDLGPMSDDEFLKAGTFGEDVQGEATSDISEETEPEPADIAENEDTAEPEPADIAENEDAKESSNFVVFLTPINRKMADEVMESIQSGNTTKPSELSPAIKDHSIDLPEGLDPSAKKIMETLAGHILNIEQTMQELKKSVSSPFFNPLGEQVSAICVSLTPEGMTVIMDNRPEEGSYFLVSVELPWRPALKFTATANVDSAEEIDGIAVVKISFTAIHPQSISAIKNYLDNGSEYSLLLNKFRAL